jgi:hypothetical protein
MLTVGHRSEIAKAIQTAKNVCHPIHLTNKAGDQRVAIRAGGPQYNTVVFSVTDNYKSYDNIEAALDDIADWLLEPEMVEGRHFVQWINHADRDCWVERLTPTRVRISFEMPTCTQGGWRKTRDLFGRRFITC